MIRSAIFSSSILFLAACGGSPEAAEDMDDGVTAPETRLYQDTPEVAHQAAEINVRAAWMRPHPGGRDVTAAYVVVQLSSGSEDLLTGARIDGAERVELHGHAMTSDGMMQMRAIGPQRVGDEGPLVFAPGARHLMVFGLDPVAEGETVSGVLEFQNAGDVPVSFEVRNMPPGIASDY